MKWLFIFLICVGFGAYLQLIKPIKAKINQCVETGTREITILQEAVEKSRYPKYQFCRESEKVIINLQNCIHTQHKESTYTYLIYDRSPAKKTATELLENHNTECDNYQVKPFKEAIYL